MVSKTFDIVVKETGLADVEKRLGNIANAAVKAQSAISGLGGSSGGGAGIEQIIESIGRQERARKKLTDEEKAYNQITKETDGVLVKLVSRYDALNKQLEEGKILQGFFDREIAKTNQSLDAHSLKLQGIVSEKAKLSAVEIEMNRILDETAGKYNKLQATQTALEKHLSSGAISWEHYQEAIKKVNTQLDAHKAKMSGTSVEKPQPIIGRGDSLLVRQEEGIQKETDSLRARTSGVTESLRLKQIALDEEFRAGKVTIGLYNQEMARLSEATKKHEMFLNGEVTEIKRATEAERAYQAIIGQTTGALERLTGMQRANAQALQNGLISQQEYARATREIGREMERVRERMGTSRRTDEQRQELQRLADAERAYQRIANETTGALQSLQAQQTALTRRFREGLLSQEAYNAEMQQTRILMSQINQRMGQGAGDMGRMSIVTGEARQNLMNLGYQVNDIVVSLASGQRPMTVFIQQGAQIAQVAVQMAASTNGLKGSLKEIGLALVSAGRAIATFFTGPIGLAIIAVTTLGYALYNGFKSSVEASTGQTVTFGDMIKGVTGYLGDMGKEVTTVGSNTQTTTGLTSELGSVGSRVYATLTEYIAGAAREASNLAFNTNEVIVKMRQQVALNNALMQGGQAGFEQKKEQDWQAFAKSQGLQPVIESRGWNLFQSWKNPISPEITLKRNEQFFKQEAQYKKEYDLAHESEKNLAIKKEADKLAIDSLNTAKQTALAAKDMTEYGRLTYQINLGNFELQNGIASEAQKAKIEENSKIEAAKAFGAIGRENLKTQKDAVASGNANLEVMRLQNQLQDQKNKKDKAGQLETTKALIRLQNPYYPPDLVNSIAMEQMRGQDMKGGGRSSGGGSARSKLTEGQKAGLKYEDIALAIQREFTAYEKLGEAKEAQIKLNQILGKFNPEQLKAIQDRIPALEQEVQRLIHKKKVNEEIDKLYAEGKGSLEAFTVKEEALNEAYKLGVLNISQYNSKLLELKANRASMAVESGTYTQNDLQAIANQQQQKALETTRIELLTKTRNELAKLNGEEQAYNEAMKAGTISQEAYNAKMIEIMAQRRNIAYSQGGGNFSDTLRGGFIGGVANDNGGLKGLETQFQSFFSSVKTGLGDSIGQAIIYGDSFSEAFGNAARQGLAQFTSGLVQLGIQWAALQVIGDSLGVGGKAGGGLGGILGGLMGASPANQNGTGQGATVGAQGGGNATGNNNPLTAPISQIGTATESALQGATGQFNQFFGVVSNGFNTTFGQAQAQTAQLGLSLQDIGMNALNTIVQGLVQVGLQWLIMETIGTAMQTAMTTSTAASAGAISAAWAPAAALASLATLGMNAAPAITGIATTTAASMAVATLGKVAGFESGGYTGGVGRKEIAGVVHGQEFVMNAEATRRNRPALEAMNAGRSMSSGTSSGGGNSPRVVVHNYGSSKITAEITHDEIRIIAREESARTVQRETPRIVAREIENPNSRSSKSLARNTKTQRRI